MRRVNIDFRYDAHISLDGIECFYCDQYADTIDHVPPVNLVKFYNNCYKILVKACKECNYCLSDKFLPTLISRIEFLIKKYKRRYSKIIKMPMWSEWELSELKGSLKIYIEQEIKNKLLIIKRMEHLEKKLSELLGGMDAVEFSSKRRLRTD